MCFLTVLRTFTPTLLELMVNTHTFIHTLKYMHENSHICVLIHTLLKKRAHTQTCKHTHADQCSAAVETNGISEGAQVFPLVKDLAETFSSNLLP